MNLVKIALSDIDEQSPLHDQGEATIPLLGLAQAYNNLTAKHSHLVQLTEYATGAQLKEALQTLRLKDQIAVLQFYKDGMRAVNLSSSPMPLESPEPPSAAERLAQLEAEERIRFRARARWVLLLTFAPIPPLLAGAMIVVSWYKGIGMDSTVVKSVVSTATEMLKLIFTI